MKVFTEKPFFLLLLPAFFMLHVLMENYVPGMTGTAIEQTLLFSGAGVALTALFYFLFRHLRKAALLTFYILAFNFFFGSLHDFAKAQWGVNVLVVRYIFIIPLFLLILLAMAICLKRSRQPFLKITLFLNLLFGLLIIVDLVFLLPRVLDREHYSTPNLGNKFVSCDTCSLPDVYVIIPDEYAGQQELKEIFSFDNSAFENELTKRGFRVIGNTRSNYNATVYSMASLFSMHYPELTADTLVTQRDMLLCRNIINRNNTTRFFSSLGYRFINNSLFDFNNQEKAVTKYYFLPKRLILTSQTFIRRFLTNAGFNFFSKQTVERLINHDLNNDRKLDSLTRQAALQKDQRPKFVYCHFTMPHAPYYFDRDGRPFSLNDSLGLFDQLKIQYTEFLQYTNKRLLSLIDHIKLKSRIPPVILLLSDHGFRQFVGNADKKYYFMNLTAVHLPSGNYAGFYEGISPVNIFRQILNSEFNQRLPLLKDSTSFIIEKGDIF